MTPLLLIPFYTCINRWIGSGYMKGKGIGRVFFALPIALMLYATVLNSFSSQPWAIGGSVITFAWVFFMRNLPHGLHYTVGAGQLTSGFLRDFLYMTGKGAAIFLPLLCVDVELFLALSIAWPLGYILGWSYPRSDMATLYSEFICGHNTGLLIAQFLLTTDTNHYNI